MYGLNWSGSEPLPICNVRLARQSSSVYKVWAAFKLNLVYTHEKHMIISKCGMSG